MKTDEPVLHALIFGFRERYARKRLLAYVERPNLKSDLMDARREIRSNHVMPHAFKGDIHLLASEGFLKQGSVSGWEKHVDGHVHIHAVEGDHSSYLKERLTETALEIRKILGK